MNVIICKNKQEVAKEAYKIVKDRINNCRAKVLGLPTGTTPEGLYAEMVKGYKKGEIDFSDVHTFNLDEYIGLQKDHPQSYRNFMDTRLFNHINIKKENIDFLDGLTDDIDRECERYEAAMEALGGIKLQIVGVGRDGHIGFNEPGTSLTSRTHMITLAQSTITDNANLFFGGDESQVPRWALSMGVGTVLDTQEVLMIAFGANKADAIKGMLEGPITTMNTSSALQLHPNVTVIIDEAAASKLEYHDYYKRIAPGNIEAMYSLLEKARAQAAKKAKAAAKPAPKKAAAKPAPKKATAKKAAKKK